MEQMDKLPLPAAIAFGIVLAVIFAVRYFGIMQGQRTSPAASQAGAQVAAVIVDPTALNRASAAVEALNETLKDMKGQGRELSDVVGSLSEEVDRMREELRIHREVRRR